LGLTIYIGSNFDTKGEQKVFKKIKSLYENEKQTAFLIYDVPVNFDLGNNRAKPDFIVIDELYGIAIIEVKDWHEKSIKSVDTQQIQLSNGKTIGNPVSKADYYFNVINNLFENKTKRKWNRKIIKSNLIMTEISKRPDIQLVFKKSGLSKTFFKEDINEIEIQDIFHDLPIEIGIDLAKFCLATIKPEAYVGKTISYTRRELEERKEEILLLDEKQISVINFPDIGHYLVSGIPGSGKTITAVVRGFKLLELNPAWEVVIICFNRALKRKIEDMATNRMKLLIAHAKEQNFEITGKVEIKTFHSLCHQITNKKVNDYQSPEKWENSKKTHLV
jgi:hypothetical protein